MLPRPSPSQAAAPRLVIERLSDRLATLLAAQVESGSLSPGDRLPTEQQLAQAHGVSRTVVREAVHQLTSRGLLISRQGSGVYVSKAPRNHALSFDAAVLESIDAVVRVREVRRALEGETAALAASRATRLQVAALRRALKAIDKSTAEGGDGVAEDLAFHRALTDAAGNPHFGRLLEFLEQYLAEAMRVTRIASLVYCSRNSSRRPKCGLPAASASRRWKARSSSTPSRASAVLRSIARKALRRAATWARVARSAASAAVSASSARRTSRTRRTSSIESISARSSVNASPDGAAVT